MEAIETGGGGIVPEGKGCTVWNISARGRDLADMIVMRSKNAMNKETYLTDPRFKGIEPFEYKVWGRYYNRDNQQGYWK